MVKNFPNPTIAGFSSETMQDKRKRKKKNLLTQNFVSCENTFTRYVKVKTTFKLYKG